MNEKNGLTFTGALQIALIILKLTGIYNRSWFMVLLPIELSVIVVIMIVIIWLLAWRR